MINNTQTTSWQEFATGDYAFAENGTWQLANAKKAGFAYGIIPIPARVRRHRPGADRRRVRDRPGAEGHRPLHDVGRRS